MGVGVAVGGMGVAVGVGVGGMVVAVGSAVGEAVGREVLDGRGETAASARSASGVDTGVGERVASAQPTTTISRTVVKAR
jgi:hypothetical protein